MSVQVTEAPRQRSLRRRIRKFFTRRLAVLVASVVPPLYIFYMNLVWRTSRIEHIGWGPFNRARRHHEGMVGALWHETVFFVAYAFREFRASTLASVSDLGQLITRMLELCNFEVFRGGSSKGRSRRRKVLGPMIEHMQTHRDVVYGITTDGSNGPAHVMKPGVVLIARACGVPIFPTHVVSRPSLRAPSWDRTRIPLPFSRIVVITEGPFYCPADADEAAVEAKVREVEEALRRVAARADAYLETGVLPPPVRESSEFGPQDLRRGPIALRADEFMEPRPRPA